VNRGENYFSILSNLGNHLSKTTETVKEKYEPNDKADSQWDSRMIIWLFVTMGVFGFAAMLVSYSGAKFLVPRSLRTEAFKQKRSLIILTAAVLIFAVALQVIRLTWSQNFYIMASSLLTQYAWLLGVILLSLLARVEATQLRYALRIYAPLLAIGFIVIAFRIILIPNELVNMIFPPMLLVCALWQWWVIKRYNSHIPRSDKFYTYVSLLVYVAAVVASWMGYTLMSVQLLIWWIMQLTCILTITCVSLYLKQYGERHGFNAKPITKTWLYRLLYQVLLPVTSVASIMVSIYWAADVFNLSDLCWQIFNYQFVEMKNLKLSFLSIAIVACLWFFFSYISKTLLEFLRMHFQHTDSSTADSRTVMGRNVIQVIVWGTWAIVSLTIMDVSSTWLVVISGGLSTGIGFAMKDIIENIYYGITLMAGRIKVGDWIEVDGTMGKVTSISYTSTIVNSLYGEVITFQNSQLFSKNYKNLTRNHGYVLALVPFGVAYGSNVNQVKEVVEKAVTQLHHKWTDTSKAVKVVFTEFGDSSVNLKVIVWVDAVKKIYAVSDIMACIYQTLADNNIEIPFPQRDIHIKER
jgi:small-conductance mechanosensitive channel